MDQLRFGMDVIQWFEGLSDLGKIAEALIALVGGAKFLHFLLSGSKKKTGDEPLEKSFA